MLMAIRFSAGCTPYTPYKPYKVLNEFKMFVCFLYGEPHSFILFESMYVTRWVMVAVMFAVMFMSSYVVCWKIFWLNQCHFMQKLGCLFANDHAGADAHNPPTYFKVHIRLGLHV